MVNVQKHLCDIPRANAMERILMGSDSETHGNVDNVLADAFDDSMPHWSDLVFVLFSEIEWLTRPDPKLLISQHNLRE